MLLAVSVSSEGGGWRGCIFVHIGVNLLVCYVKTIDFDSKSPICVFYYFLSFFLQTWDCKSLNVECYLFSSLIIAVINVCNNLQLECETIKCLSIKIDFYNQFYYGNRISIMKEGRCLSEIYRGQSQTIAMNFEECIYYFTCILNVAYIILKHLRLVLVLLFETVNTMILPVNTIFLVYPIR